MRRQVERRNDESQALQVLSPLPPCLHYRKERAGESIESAVKGAEGIKPLARPWPSWTLCRATTSLQARCRREAMQVGGL